MLTNFEPPYFKERADIVDDLKILDFIVQSNSMVYVFQRKTVSDFFSTLMHRKDKEAMWNTLKALRDYKTIHNIPAYLILEGNVYKEIKIHKYPYMLWVGMRRVITFSYQIPIIHTDSIYDTWTCLSTLNKSLEEPKEYVPPPPVSKKNRSLSRCQEDMICSAVDKLGRKKARALLKHFGSIYTLVNAEKDELTEIKGIGEKLADALYNVIRSPYHEDAKEYNQKD